MNIEDFNALVEERVNKIKSVLASKGKEYGIGDRLHNFKVAGRIGDNTPERALKGMWLKHLVSVFDLIDACDQRDRSLLTRPIIDEKIGDSINYLILLEALLRERIGDS